jgi:hypothetical protein
MEELVQSLARDNVTEVKVVLASVVGALAIYQLVLIAIGYGKLRLPFLSWGPATRAHRLTGDVIVALTAAVSIACLSVYGFDEDGGTHAISGAALAAAIGLKIVTVRYTGGHSRWLAPLGGLIFVLLAITWWTSAAAYLGEE